MKWNVIRATLGDFDSYKARYKNFSIEVSGGRNGWENKIGYYYFMIKNTKIDFTFNSLWEEMKFPSLEEAQAAAVEWVEAKLKAMKD